MLELTIKEQKMTFPVASLLIVCVFMFTTDLTRSSQIVIISDNATIAQAGGSGVFACVASGNPAPSLSWSRGGASLKNSSRFRIYEELRVTVNGLTFVRSVFEICNVEPDDAAQYICVADNTACSANFNLTVNLCGALTNPENGQVSYTTGTNFGLTATYGCNTGYNLMGGSIRTCQTTGVWSGSEPTCEAFDGCLSGRDSRWNIIWANTARNAMDTQQCPGGLGNATRLCMRDGNWADPNVLGCESQQFRQILMQAEDIFSSNRTAAEVLERSASLTSQLAVATETSGASLLPSELNTTNSILSRVIDVLENSVSLGIAPPSEAIVDVLSNTLEESNVNGWSDLQMVSPGSQILLNNAERYGIYLARSRNVTNTAQVLSRRNIVISAKEFVASNTDVSSLDNEAFPMEEDLVNFTQQVSPAQISIPPQILLEAISRSSSDGSIPIAHILFHNLDEFLPSAVDGLNSQVVSTVLSSQVGNRQTTGVSTDTLELNPISLTFRFLSVNESSKYKCTYWNFSEPVGSGSWVTGGISTNNNTTVGNSTSVQCLSTHLTSFAVLVDVAGGLQNIEEVERKALHIVSYIGCTISTFCLIIAVVFFLFQGRKLLSAIHMFLHLNLCISLLLGYLTFMVGIETATSSTGGCAFVAALLHYFFLAASCWMLCEGVMLYLKLVVVFSNLSKKWWFYLLLGWVTPLLFVVIAVGSRHQYYGVHDKNGKLLFCWMSVEKGTIYAFVAPAVVIILINVVFLCFVVRSILKAKKLHQKQEWKKLEVITLAKTTFKATVILLPLLGLTWVFGVLTIDRNTTVFAWLFTICNSTQGIAILFFHVIRNEMVWSKICSQFTNIHHKTLSSSLKSQKCEGPSSSGIFSKGGTLETKTETHGYELNTLPTSVVCSHPKRETSLSDVPLDKGEEAIDSGANDTSPDNSKISMEGKTLEGPHYPEKGISINTS